MMNMYTIVKAAELTAGDIKKLPKNVRKAHEFAMKATKNGTSMAAYNGSDVIRKAVDGYLMQLTELNPKSSSSSNKKSAAVFSSKKSEETKPKVKAKKSSPIKSSSNNKNAATSADVKFVENIDLEIQFVKRYANMHGKEKTQTQVINFLKQLQKAITAKKIRRNSKFAKEIDTIQSELIKLVDKFADGKYDTITISIKDVDKYKTIGNSEKRLLSVTYMLRFIALTRKSDVVEKAERLNNQITKSIETGKIKESDKYFDKLKMMNRKLKAYTNNSGTLEVTEAQLNGLSGIVKREIESIEGVSGLNGAGAYAAGFLTSMASRYIYDKYISPKSNTNTNKVPEKNLAANDDNNADDAKVMNSEKLKTMKFETLKLEPDFAEVIGEPSDGAAIMIYGGPGSGKSTFEVLFGKSLAEYNNKKVLIITDEEGFSKTMQEKLDRLDAYHKNVFIAEEIPADIKSFDVVFFDSVQSLQLTPEQLEKFHKEHPRTLMVFVFQVTKEGKFKGEEEFEHIVDVVLHADQGIVSSIGKKNRFGGRGEIQVY